MVGPGASRTRPRDLLSVRGRTAEPETAGETREVAREESEFVLKSDFGVTLAGGLGGPGGGGGGEVREGGGVPSVAHGEVNIFPLPLSSYRSDFSSHDHRYLFCGIP